MRTLPLATALLAVLILLANCSSDSPTGPGPDPQDEVVAEGTVGAAGDTLSGDGVAVGVPAGALAGDAELTLLRENEPSLSDETDSYRLEGLPADFDEPLTIRLVAPPAMRDESGEPYVMAFITGMPAEGDTSYHMAALPAEMVGDTLVAELDPGDYLLVRGDDDKSIEGVILDLILTGTQTLGRSSVQIPIPIYVRGGADILFYRDLLLQWLVFDAERFLPLTDQFRQTLYPQQDATMPLIEADVFHNEYMASRVSGRLMRDGPDAGTVVPHVELVYSPESSVELTELRRQLHYVLWRQVCEARTGLPVDWWMYATLYALQRDIDIEISAFFDQWRPRALKGFRRTIEMGDDPWTGGLALYGYGMMDFAIWVDDHDGPGWGRDALAATVNERAGYQYDDVQFLADALPGSPNQWWPDFLVDLLTGQVRPYPHGLYLGAVTGDWTIDDDGDESHTFTDEHVSLDADLHRVRLERDDFLEAESLRFDVSDPRNASTLVVFAVDDTGWEEIDRGASVTVDQLDVKAALDQDLVVAVANFDMEADDDSRRDISVSVLLTDGTPPPDITTFDEITIEIVTDNTYSNGVVHRNEHLFVTSDMAWNGAGFSWADNQGSGHGDTISISVNPETMALGSWFGSTFYEAINGNEHYVRLAGEGVPLSEWGEDDWGTRYVRWVMYGGEEICERLSAVYHEQWTTTC